MGCRFLPDQREPLKLLARGTAVVLQWCREQQTLTEILGQILGTIAAYLIFAAILAVVAFVLSVLLWIVLTSPSPHSGVCRQVHIESAFEVCPPYIFALQSVENKTNKVLDKPNYLRYYSNHDEHQ